jgi:hypothetical protein
MLQVQGEVGHITKGPHWRPKQHQELSPHRVAPSIWRDPGKTAKGTFGSTVPAALWREVRFRCGAFHIRRSDKNTVKGSNKKYVMTIFVDVKGTFDNV